LLPYILAYFGDFCASFIFKTRPKLYKEILDTYGTDDSYETEAVAYLYGELETLRVYVEHIVEIAEKTGRGADAVNVPALEIEVRA